jgi:signal transduction histidine kinase
MVNEKTIILTVLAGSLFIVVIIIFIFVVGINYRKKMIERDSDYQLQLKNKELEMLKRVIETQETERQKIAANLHDEINPLLVSMKHVLTAQSRELAEMGIDSSRISNQNEVINSVIENIQSSTRDLSPRILYKFGLARGINSYLGDIEGVDVRYDFSGEDYLEHTETINLNIYRITLELINNIRKYERITKLHVSLNCTERTAILRILHDGEGITNEEFNQYASQSRGIGLNSIISRVKLLEARLDLTKDKDSEIVLEVPLFNARKD